MNERLIGKTAFVTAAGQGIGRATALAFARILLCHDTQADLGGHTTACGACESCRLLAAESGVHPDLHIVTKELARFSDKAEVRLRKLMSIPVDVLRRSLIEPVNLAARVTGTARPGSVLVAEAAREAIGDDDRFTWSFAGARHLKGIKSDVKLFRARRAASA